MVFRVLLCLGVVLLTSLGSASAQGTGGNSGSSRSTTQPNSGSSSRSSNSSFGSPANFSQSRSGDPFQAARSDPTAQGRATNTSRNSSFSQAMPANFLSRSSAISAPGGGGQLGRLRSVTRISFPTVEPSRMEILQAAKLSLNTAALPGQKNIEISYQEGIATLTGSVSTRREADLAATLIALEPGVRSVQNLLDVEPRLGPGR